MATGNLWECISGNAEDEIFKQLPKFIQESQRFLEGRTADACEIIYKTRGEGPVRYVTITKRNSENGHLHVSNFLPVIYNGGSEHRLTVKNITENDDQGVAIIEADITGSEDDTVFFLAPLYYHDRNYIQRGGSYLFNLSILMLNTDPGEPEVITVPDILQQNKKDPTEPDGRSAMITISTENITMFANCDETDQYDIMGKVEEITFHSTKELDYCKIKSNFPLFSENVYEFTLYGFVNTRNRLIPVRDWRINTPGWMQGHLVVER